MAKSSGWSNLQDYVHRIGRTGRAGEKGLSCASCDRGKRTVGMVVVKNWWYAIYQR
jgi:superfamily II DNA/RNA helicase